jgi:hypothetical protein
MDPANDHGEARERFDAQLRGGALRASAQPIRFAGSVLGAQRHVCAFFHSPDEEYRVLLPFIKEGFERARRRSISSIPSCERNTYGVWSLLASLWRRQKRMGSLSCAIGLTRICATATSIRIRCWL